MNLYKNYNIFSDFVKCKDLRDGDDEKITKQPASATRLNRPAINGTDYAQAIESDANIGGVLKDGFIVIDIDDEKEANQYFNYVVNNNIKTIVVKTDRGRHFYFKYTQKNPNLKNNTNIKTFLGISVDYRIGGIKGYLIIKRFGKYRTIEKWTEPNQLAELPIYFKKPLFNLNKRTRPNESYELKNAFEMKDGDKRHMYLFNDFSNLLLNNGYTQAEADEVIKFTNFNIFAEPKPPKEIENIIKSHQKKPRQYKNTYSNFTCADVDSILNDTSNQATDTTDGADTQNDEIISIDNNGADEINNKVFNNPKLTKIQKIDFLARLLIKKLDIKQEDNLLYYFSENYYKELSLVDLATYAIFHYKEFTTNDKSNLLDRLRAYAPRYQSETRSIALNNCILLFNEDEIEIIEDTTRAREYFSKIKINVNYDKSYKNQKIDFVDNFFLELASNDKNIAKLLMQTIAYCFYPFNKLAKIFFLVGNGNNGKSTFLNLLVNIIGKNNIASITPQTLQNNRFATANLINKLANIENDISNEKLKGTDIIKKIATGDTISAERKGEQAFNFSPFAKQFYGCNNPPNFDDNSNGTRRRFVYIPFNNDFTNKEDKHILEKLLEHKDYIVYCAIENLKVLLKDGFIECKEARKITEEIFKNNDSIYNFLYNYEAENNKQIYNEKIGTIYTLYKDYCIKNKINNYIGRNFFTTDVKRYLPNISKANITKNKKTDSYYIASDNVYLSLIDNKDNDDTITTQENNANVNISIENKTNDEIIKELIKMDNDTITTRADETIINDTITTTQDTTQESTNDLFYKIFNDRLKQEEPTDGANVVNNANINEDNEDNNDDNKILWGTGLNAMTKKQWEERLPEIQKENAHQKEYLRNLESKEEHNEEHDGAPTWIDKKKQEDYFKDLGKEAKDNIFMRKKILSITSKIKTNGEIEKFNKIIKIKEEKNNLLKKACRERPIGDFSNKTIEEIKEILYKGIFSNEKTDNESINYFLSKNFYYSVDKQILANIDNRIVYLYNEIEKLSLKECINILDTNKPRMF